MNSVYSLLLYINYSDIAVQILSGCRSADDPGLVF